MPITLSLFLEEIKFLESTAQKALKENFIEGWFIGSDSFARLNVSNASEEQKEVLLRRLGGYHPNIMDFRGDDLMLINLNEILDF